MSRPSGNDATPVPWRILLTGIPRYGPILLVSRTVLMIGTPRDPTVDLAVQGPLRSRHAVLICDEAPMDKVEEGEYANQGPAREWQMRWFVLPLADALVEVNELPAPPGVLRRLTDGDRLGLGLGCSEWLFRHPDRFESTAILESTERNPGAARIDELSTASTVVIGRGALVIGRDSRRVHLVQRSLPCQQVKIWQDRLDWFVSSDEHESCVFVNNGELRDHQSTPQSLPLHIQISADGPQWIERALNGVGAPLEVHLRLTKLL